MRPLDDTKYRNRARLEVFAHANDGTVEYHRGEDGWTATAKLPHLPGGWIVTSGPHESLEAACAVVIDRFAEAGQLIQWWPARRPSSAMIG